MWLARIATLLAAGRHPMTGRKAAIWARVSTDRQETENQLRVLREMATRRGDEVVREFLVEASAWTGKHRKGLAAAVDEGRRGGFSVVYSWALDRITREGPLEMLKVVDRFGRVGVQVISYEEPWTEVADEMLDLLLSIAGWAARQESRRKSEQVKIGMERARAEGKPIGRPQRRPVEQLRRWPEVRDLVVGGVLTRAEGARRLKVRYGDFLEALSGSASTSRP